MVPSQLSQNKNERTETAASKSNIYVYIVNKNYHMVNGEENCKVNEITNLNKEAKVCRG